MARIVVAGAGAIGASIAYHLALLGGRQVVLCDRAEVAAGATGRAMGGVRQQFSTPEEVVLARESIRFFEELGTRYFQQVGYLFVATTEDGMAALAARREVQVELGVPVELVSAERAGALAPGLETSDLAGGVFCATDGVADPPGVTRELVRRSRSLGVELREGTTVEEVDADLRIIACGARSAEVAAAFGIDLPVRPLVRQLFETAPVAGLASGLPMTLEAESAFHFRRRGDALRVAMPDPVARWSFDEAVDEDLIPDRLERLRRRFPPAAGAPVVRAWAGLYDMTPDAHPIIGPVGESLYAACGFSGHGFMQAPAVGRAVAEEILRGRATLDLSPYRLERFSGPSATFPEEVVF